MEFDLFIPLIAKWLGISQATLVLYIVLIGTVANVISRLIPDDATGWLARVRFVAKLVGLHVSSRVTSGVRTADVVNEIVGAKVAPETKETIRVLASDSESLIPEVVSEPPREIVEDPFGKAAQLIQPESNEENLDA